MKETSYLEMNKRHYANIDSIRFLLIGVVFVLLVACSSDARQPTPTVDSEILSVADLTDSSEEEVVAVELDNAETGVEEEGPIELIDLPALTVEDIFATWAASENLDSTHQIVGSACGSCHELPDNFDLTQPECHGCHPTAAEDGIYAAPESDELCLNCHESRSAVTLLTNDYQPANPHDYHYTIAIQCSMCHIMHQPLAEPCGLCHGNIELTKPGQP